MDKLYKIAAAHAAYFKNYHKYKMLFWDEFDYDLLSRNIMYYKKKGKYQKGTWNDVIIALTNMGYDKKNCETVIEKIAKDIDSSLSQSAKEELLFRKAIVELSL